MKKKVLILTDHSNHSKENSLYDLSVKMLENCNVETVDIVSRTNKENEAFFSGNAGSLWATRIDHTFAYQNESHPLSDPSLSINLKGYDLVWLRLPPPLGKDFLDRIAFVFKDAVIINNPKSIHLTGSKKFLMNFSSFCPPMRICKSIDNIDEFRKEFPIVLKPFHAYGGQGILKIENELVSSGTTSYSFNEFVSNYQKNPIEYLGVKYLKNVRQGDKRIIVVNGQILGASLRLPAENNWLCNVAMGGSSNMTEVDRQEEQIVKHVNPILIDHGIVMYGIDTLVNDEGKRVLSEINTTSIGGLPQIAAMRNEPLIEKAIDLIWDYYNVKIQEDE